MNVWHSLLLTVAAWYLMHTHTNDLIKTISKKTKLYIKLFSMSILYSLLEVILVCPFIKCIYWWRFFAPNPDFPRTLRSAKKQSATVLLCKAVVTKPIHHFVSDSVQPHRRQPTRLPRPWDSPGKNTGVGRHFLLQSVKVKSLSRVQPSATPWTAAFQARLSMGFSRQKYWSGVPLPSLNKSLNYTQILKWKKWIY